MLSKKILMYCLFTGTCSAVIGGGIWGFERVDHASQRVAARHLIGTPPTATQKIKEIAVEAVKGGPGVIVGTGAFAGVPLAPVSNERIGTWDPGTVAELQREGIDVTAVNEIRAALRDVLCEPDPNVRKQKALDLRAKYGVTADPALLGRLDRIDARGRVHGTLTEQGKVLIAGMTASIARLYQGLVKEVDR